jgi:archaeal flagellar protein FlaJ
MSYTLINGLAYKFFGEFFYKNKKSFQNLRTKVRHSHIPMSVDQYMAFASFCAIIAGLIGGIFGVLLSFKTLLIPGSQIGFYSPAFAGFVGNHLYLFTALVSLSFFFLSFILIFSLILVYPYFQADIRHACIDRSMLSTVTYIYALTKGGMSIYEVFRSLSKYTHIFGTSSEEISYIVKDIDFLGKDYITALKSARERTPSPLFKEFIDGLILVSSRKTVTEYIKNKSEQYQNMAELANRNFLKRLDVLAEIYVTLLIAGPLFVITTLIVLQFLRPASTQALYLLVYVIIPLSSLLFLIFLDTIGELSVNLKKTKPPVFSVDFSDIPEINSGLSVEDEKERNKKFLLNRQFSKIKNLVLNPYKTIRDEPRYTFFLGIPLGFYYLSYIPGGLIAKLNQLNFPGRINLNFAHISNNSVELMTQLDDYFIIFLIIILIPFILFYEIREWRMRKIDEQMPDFFKNLSSMNQSGILLTNSLKIMAESNMGILNKELQKLKEDISWATPTSRALMKFETNIRTAISSRMLHILIKANESTSDIKSVLSIIAQQVKSEEDLRKERASKKTLYVITIYVAFFVILFVIYILAIYFFPQSASFGNPSGAEYAGIGNINFNIPEYTMLMFHCVSIQGFTSGIIAGKMGQGSSYLGLKYSVSMIIITYIVFTMFV